jgi:6-phosphogluconate dehydrogenase/gluconokinase
MIVIICGVSGTGKTTIGKLLSVALKVPFYDADDFHSAANIEKMASGIPLDDEDRQPWLESLAGMLPAWQAQGGAVLACSALKESYRVTLKSHFSGYITWIILHGSNELIADRLISRKGHFFDEQLLNSQLDAFEKPDYGWLIDVESSPQEIVNIILERLRSE